jgi:hypothetical protein
MSTLAALQCVQCWFKSLLWLADVLGMAAFGVTYYRDVAGLHHRTLTANGNQLTGSLPSWLGNHTALS